MQTRTNCLSRHKDKKSKSKCQEIHAKKRAYQRFGIDLDTELLVKDIQYNKLQFIEKQSNRVTVWRKIDKEEQLDIVVLYDKLRKQIITVMPYSMYMGPLRIGDINVKEENQESERKESRKETECTDKNQRKLVCKSAICFF